MSLRMSSYPISIGLCGTADGEEPGGSPWWTFVVPFWEKVPASGCDWCFSRIESVKEGSLTEMAGPQFVAQQVEGWFRSPEDKPWIVGPPALPLDRSRSVGRPCGRHRWLLLVQLSVRPCSDR